jgi:hypothetical protein
MQVHDLAKDEWLLFTTQKWMELFTEIVIHDD